MFVLVLCKIKSHADDWKSLRKIFCRSDRQANEDVTINGIHIPKGLIVIFSIYALHHDPEYWTEPGKFKPER
jgi:cytochrome P450